MGKDTRRQNVMFDDRLEAAAERIKERESITTISGVVRSSILRNDLITEITEKGGVLKAVYPDGTVERLIFL